MTFSLSLSAEIVLGKVEISGNTDLKPIKLKTLVAIGDVSLSVDKL
ncbi:MULTISPECIES: hypothetical protein [unclassified Microcoleus]